MIEKLKEHIVKRVDGNLENIDIVLSKFQLIKLKKNQILLTQGEICKYVYFLAEGCLQVYVYDTEMNEMTRDIVIENNWCSELVSFSKEIPSIENIRAIENCILFSIDKKSFQEMMLNVPQFDIIYKQILELSYANSIYRVNSFVSMTSLERIKWLMNNRPSLMVRVSSKLIASYLGINKDVFSRLKSKL